MYVSVVKTLYNPTDLNTIHIFSLLQLWIQILFVENWNNFSSFSFFKIVFDILFLELFSPEKEIQKNIFLPEASQGGGQIFYFLYY